MHNVKARDDTSLGTRFVLPCFGPHAHRVQQICVGAFIIPSVIHLQINLVNHRRRFELSVEFSFSKVGRNVNWDLRQFSPSPQVYSQRGRANIEGIRVSSFTSNQFRFVYPGPVQTRLRWRQICLLTKYQLTIFISAIYFP